MRTAIIAGRGGFPAAVVAAAEAAGAARPLIAALDGFAPEGLAADITFRVERLYPFFAALREAGVGRVCFVGAVERPRLDPALFDPLTAAQVPRLLAAMAQGDDATLREVAALFEEEELPVIAAHEIAPELVAPAGVLAGTPGERDQADAARAAAIVEAIGRVDVGQGCVVAGGICLAVEAIGGTDRMLAQVAALPAALRPQGGLLYKAPKPGQDLRFDMPALGPETLRAAARAGLSGVAFEAGGVICLELAEMRRVAEEAGLFLWAREP